MYYLIPGIKQNSGSEITQQEQQVISAYRNLSDSDKRIADFILGIREYDIKSNPVEIEPVTIYRFPVFNQEAAAGVGILNNSDNLIFLVLNKGYNRI
ncbi:MAG: hypothetical protein NC318_12060 [Blautia sp.]|nr:hypothetical protein [Lachnoclostridium sp.]MCM1212326.1 hypothetical protein [Blautia sp.]